MTFEDLSSVCALQCAAYPPTHWEHPSTFLRKWVLHSSGCFVGVAGVEVAGYAFTHPWSTSAATPSFNAGRSFELPSSTDCLYIHDVAVRPDARGNGLAR